MKYDEALREEGLLCTSSRLCRELDGCLKRSGGSEGSQRLSCEGVAFMFSSKWCMS